MTEHKQEFYLKMYYLKSKTILYWTVLQGSFSGLHKTKVLG